ncbi:hypothetical protein N8475_08040 [Winogradskyella sp.]|nr:hypothetical protein [Winogradskyella sp.]
MIAFIHTYKTAGTSIKWIFRSSYGLRHLDITKWDESKIPHDSRILHSPDPINSVDLKRVIKYMPHVKSILGHEVMGFSDLEKVMPDIQYCTFMRDPIKQTASWFQYLINVGNRKELDFKSYMKSEFPKNRQVKMIAGKEDLDTALKIIKEKKIFMGLTERFDESLLLFKKLYCPSLSISYSRRGIATDKSIFNELLEDEETYQILLDSTKLDRKLYDIVQNEIFPNYLNLYGNEMEADLKHFKEEKKKFNMTNVNLSRIQSKYLFQKVLVKSYRNGVLK